MGLPTLVLHLGLELPNTYTQSVDTYLDGSYNYVFTCSYSSNGNIYIHDHEFDDPSGNYVGYWSTYLGNSYTACLDISSGTSPTSFNVVL